MNKAGWKKCNTKEFWADIAPCDHVVQLYEDDDILIDTLSDFASNGFNAGDSLILIATELHIRVLNKRLEEKGYDIQELIGKDAYIPLDATDTLSKFMINGTPDEKSFLDTIVPVMERARKSGVRVRAFGEMVALLWESGESRATIQLENLWNKFSETQDFCLFCAYPKEGFKNDAGASIMHICSAHTKVIGTDMNFPLDIQYRNVV